MTDGEGRVPASSKPSRAGIALVILAATILRFWALPQGLPFSPGIDEAEVMDRAVRMMKTGDFNPHFFDYPSLYIYVQSAVAVVRFMSGAIGGLWSSLAQAPTEAFYLWGRAVSAILGTATVGVLYRAGLYWDHRTALIGSLMLAVMPMHVRESHYVLTDVPVTFFVAVTLLLSLRARERPTAAAFALAGVAAGFAGATKYYGIMAVEIPLLACMMTPATRPSRLLAVLWIIGSTLAAFCLAAPYTLLDLPTFLNQFARLASEYRRPASSDAAWLLYLKHLRLALGWTGSLVVSIGLVIGLARILRSRDRAIWVMPVLFSMTYYFFISRQNLVFGRYLLPLVPFVCLFAAWGITGAAAALSRTRGVPARQLAFLLLILVALVPSAYTSIMYDLNAAKTWTSEQAYRWIAEKVPHNSAVVIETRVIVLPADYRVQYVKQLTMKSSAAYAAAGVDYLVATSEVFGRHLSGSQLLSPQGEDYQRLFGEVAEVARFSPSAAHPGPEIRILKVRP